MGKHKGSVKQRALSSRGQPSAFEQASVSRKKHTVIGARDKGSKGRSAMQARARGEQMRRETLLVEHQQKGRTNAFIDGRFGENDEGMPEEDKLVHRFQRERQRQIKKSRYALADEDEDGVVISGGDRGDALGAASVLTHGGRAIGDMEEFSDADLGDSDDEGGGRGGRQRNGGFEGADFVRGAHFGGNDDENGDGDGERKLSAKELLEQTIAKYKLAKLDRQEEKQAQNKEIEQLDADFDAIRGLVFATGSKKAAAEKAAASGGASTSTLAAERALASSSSNGAISSTGPSGHSDLISLPRS